MDNNSFETLKMPAEYYIFCVKFVVVISFVFLIVMILFHYMFRDNKSKIKFHIEWYFHIPKMAICFMAVLMTFFYDYQNKCMVLPDFYNMYASTFFVGILALIDMISIITSIIKDLCDDLKEIYN